MAFSLHSGTNPCSPYMTVSSLTCGIHTKLRCVWSAFFCNEGYTHLSHTLPCFFVGAAYLIKGIFFYVIHSEHNLGCQLLLQKALKYKRECKMDTGRERDRFPNHTGYERASISLSSIVEPHIFRNGGIFLLNKLLERGKDTLHFVCLGLVRTSAC